MARRHGSCSRDGQASFFEHLTPMHGGTSGSWTRSPCRKRPRRPHAPTLATGRTRACRVMSDVSRSQNASRTSLQRCGNQAPRRNGGISPIWLAAREPLRSKRCTHLMAEDLLTPKRAAAARRYHLPESHRVQITRSVASPIRHWPSLLASAQPAGCRSEQCRHLGNPNRFKLGPARHRGGDPGNMS